ncbi:thioredoxin family protein [Geoalkalibacter sp.]|uniref:thioredoxin family protein n=1 Tax=Geoalkalibacter sp. TaxID=3041440 RepID=UPI00272E8C71|nr:thioredoxin family protein [Geoalkalibacter sp.]
MKKIKILGTGCAKCHKLEENAKAAAAALGLDCEFEKVSNINDIVKFGILAMPGLVVDDKLVSSGKVLSAEDIKKSDRLNSVASRFLSLAWVQICR